MRPIRKTWSLRWGLRLRQAPDKPAIGETYQGFSRKPRGGRRPHGSCAYPSSATRAVPRSLVRGILGAAESGSGTAAAIPRSRGLPRPSGGPAARASCNHPFGSEDESVGAFGRAALRSLRQHSASSLRARRVVRSPCPLPGGACGGIPDRLARARAGRAIDWPGTSAASKRWGAVCGPPPAE